MSLLAAFCGCTFSTKSLLCQRIPSTKTTLRVKGTQSTRRLTDCTSFSSTTRSQARFSTRSPVTQPVLPTRVGICTFLWTGSSTRFTASLGACTTTRLHAEELLRAEDQKLSCPESHSSCHITAGDELSAKKQVVKMAPAVKPTPIRISAVSPCSSVSGRLSTKRRFAVGWISLYVLPIEPAE